MNTFLVLCIIAAGIATVVALIRGIVTFLRTTEEDLKSGTGPSASSLKQNRMMFARVGFQAAAIMLIALLLLMNGGSQ
ncbi:twin transmembrane helix small protein [Sphingobium aquiterrae]|uniref:twin transmembrane helix small protein n=1 Tax=Sphingobium aquiterrae TaxID=2038656 RepID=UPI003015CE18